MAAESTALNVGTRESQLARWQTDEIVAHLKEVHSDLQFSVVGISTKGDKILDKPLPKIGDKGLFTKELEVALADGRVDLVVHSLKDLPSTMPDGMVIGCIFKRADRRDALIMSQQNQGKSSLADLPPGAVVGTSSLRRIAQLCRSFGHLRCEDVRGNLNTRLRKLDADDGKYDALILAAAGMERLGWSDRITARFATDEIMYATGQGALAVEVRQSDSRALSVVEKLMHRETLLECLAERSFLQSLGGGCSVPIGVECHLASDAGDGKETVHLSGSVFSLDGKHVVHSSSSCRLASDQPMEDLESVITGVHIPEKWRVAANLAAKVGRQVASSLIDAGAEKLLEEARTAIKASQ